jgi:hypothetical protein
MEVVNPPATLMLDEDDGCDDDAGNHYADRVTSSSLSSLQWSSSTSLTWREEERIKAMSTGPMM